MLVVNLKGELQEDAEHFWKSFSILIQVSGWEISWSEIGLTMCVLPRARSQIKQEISGRGRSWAHISWFSLRLGTFLCCSITFVLLCLIQRLTANWQNSEVAPRMHALQTYPTEWHPPCPPSPLFFSLFFHMLKPVCVMHGEEWQNRTVKALYQRRK